MYMLSTELWFPDVKEAASDGLLALGGDLSIDRLKLAYTSGIFPWYGDAQPIMWWSPDPRMVLFPQNVYRSKSLQKKMDRGSFQVTFNTRFSEVIGQCAMIKRNDQGGTWITPEMQDAYIALHKAGWAKSVEVWRNEKLVGGLYGIDLKASGVFCGESMFSLESDASKIALCHLADSLIEKEYKLIDCQLYTDHLERMGAEEIDRATFLSYLSS